MAKLSNRKVAVIATNGFEDSELTSPVDAVKEAGADVTIISTEAQPITGKNGTEVQVDTTSAQAKADDFDALILPGGTGNADKIRMDEDAVKFVQDIFAAGKPTGVICHGGWILTDADVVKGRTLTSFPSIKTDLKNAGATWVDEEVHTDNGLVSSRTPDDLPAFNAKIIEEFGEGKH
ncbi:type 1 glutamine amidotransferase domain-containing protein [Corynebacterium ammoniagenes]|jgi:protease I|uniref:Protease n=2 Tax=Corynebacterium ammoniagenes TaxID=1697 RepID=A0AAV5G9L1_CORAM|nr:type 1 glutamine amidotransferase domain-containing protein [Corynebacterium ammoniagenes]APT83693.1 peptidase C56 [Corynebacterium ammoniagenes DSM 20306]AQS72491.1 peptidase C56 [Corynebacterium ammoniagenes]EFG81697.1 intracellular protease, PfpI family [Corynebacterium ammoniagenes DSM 20306]NMF32747.1 type 1 glutamine amidotransferase [Corynebacterium ammoniagenes]GJN43383.1 protease [Corynebacterium ammoniagenes]